MEWLIVTGAVLTLLGVCGIAICAVRVWKAKRAGLDDDGLRVELQKVVLWNFVALMVSAMGLMAVVIGKLLG